MCVCVYIIYLSLILTILGSTFRLILGCHGGNSLLFYTYCIYNYFCCVKPFIPNFVYISVLDF